MLRTRVMPELSRFPEAFHSLLDCPVYNSSCSKEASVWFLDREDGLYLKRSEKGSLRKEAAMTAYFHSKGLAAEVLSYISDGQDWLLTRRIPGEDCTHPRYLSDPVRLCDTLAQTLRCLHDMDFAGCPVGNRNDAVLKTVCANREAGRYDHSLFRESRRCSGPEEAWQLILEGRSGLKADTLLHGDYCLPNIMLEDWAFSGFIDLGNGGVGDRHFDVFWGLWTLAFNLKTTAFQDRFLDVYGREAVEPQKLRLIAALESFA